MEDHEDKEELLTERILGLIVTSLVAAVTLVLLFHEIPKTNEVLLGTLLGFIFGNMAGPVYRKFFGGPDTGSQKAATAASNALQSAVDKISPQAASGIDITVKPGDARDDAIAASEPPEGNRPV